MKAYVTIKSLSSIHVDQDAAIELSSYQNHFTREQIRQICVANGSQEFQGIVGIHEHNIVAGYVVYRILPYSIEIMTGAVATSQRRLSIGTQLIDHIKSVAALRSKPVVRIGIAETNYAAQSFLKCCGFICIGIEKELQTWHGDTGFYHFKHDPNARFTNPKNRIKSATDHG